MASPRGKNDSNGSRENTRSLPERVGQLYYAHGLFCSSHPIPVVSFAIAVVLLCCYPLLNLPLPGNVPQQLSGNFSVIHENVSSSPEVSDTQLPRWFTGSPLCYVLQVVMKTTVSPWTEDLVLTDAFRAPLAEVFKLLEVIRNYQHENSSRSLSHVCLHIESSKVKSDKKMALPEYSCLTLSPANLWQQNLENFQEDSNLLGTIFTYQSLQKGKISLAEILFGMHMKDTGIKRYPLRTRQRILQYAVTLVLQDYDTRYVDGLRQKLMGLYPLHQPHNSVSSSQWSNNGETFSNTTTSQHFDQETLHIYYPGQFTFLEFVPLTVTYFILFLYMYFSVRKIELVKSKLGMAFSAVVTVLASLSMSIGLCFFFGLTLTFTGTEVFPYLVVIVGLENILVLTKSVVSTPTHLDVKIRVAQGLSREGWSITKNLLIEVTILTIGLLTFVPAIQEFCIFAVVGLLSDYFLQMLFFSTILAIDIRRMELSSESQHCTFPYGPSAVRASSRSSLRQFQAPISNTARLPPASSKPQSQVMVRSKSHPRLNGLSSSYPTNVVAHPNSPPPASKVPKRLRLVHFWASTRIFQRAFMICMIVWIAMIMYSSGVLEQVLQMTTQGGSLPTLSERDPELMSSSLVENANQYYDINTGAHSSLDKTAAMLDNVDLGKLQSIVTEETRTVPPTSPSELKRTKGTMENVETGEWNDAIGRLKHTGYEPWRRLSLYHWPAILSLYNVSFAGRYISILPPIRLSHTVPAEQARSLRNHDEKAAQHFQWQALAAALDPIDFTDGTETGKGSVVGIKSPCGSISSGEVPYVPSSPMELFLTAVLCVISIVVLAYTMVMLYRCVCSRNYAEWRASWANDGEGTTQDGITQVVMEAVPLVLDGHPQEVECLATDGNMVVSSCLGGQLMIWDSNLGEALAIVDRKLYFSSHQRNSSTSADVDLEELPLSDYESGSPPSRGEGDDTSTSPTLAHYRKHSEGAYMLWKTPDLRPAINTNFSGIKSVKSENCSKNKNGFDFSSKFQALYDEHKKSFCDSDGDRTSNSSKSQLVYRSNNPPSLSTAFSCENVSSVKKFQPYYNNSCNHEGVDIICLPQSQRSHGGTVNKGDWNISSLGLRPDLKTSTVQSRRKSQISTLSDTLHETRVLNSSVDIGGDGKNVSVSSSYNSNLNSNVWSEADECYEIVCGVEKRAQSLPGSPSSSSWLTDCERKTSNTNMQDDGGEKDLSGTNNVQHASPVWCLDCHENLIVIGCANGRLEFWEGSTGTFKCLFEDGSGVGITSVKIIGNRVVAAKLSGCVDFLELESYRQGRQMDWGFTAYRRSHVRSGSTGSLLDWDSILNCDGCEEDLRCIRLNTTKAHQQPITVLDSEGGRVLTGSKDHTLKVFRLEDQLPLYTLHGHCGPVTCLFIDRISPMTSGSGSQDGLLCVWDLLTGACMYSLQAHDGSVTALTYSASYVISLGTDERLCVWERFQGHLLNTIQVSHAYCCSMVMLTHNLLITSKQGSLVVWDVRTGDPVRVVKLGHSDGSVFVKQILLLRDCIACDYSNQLRIVRFPLVANKCD